MLYCCISCSGIDNTYLGILFALSMELLYGLSLTNNLCIVWFKKLDVYLKHVDTLGQRYGVWGCGLSSLPPFQMFQISLSSPSSSAIDTMGGVSSPASSLASALPTAATVSPKSFSSGRGSQSAPAARRSLSQEDVVKDCHCYHISSSNVLSFVLCVLLLPNSFVLHVTCVGLELIYVCQCLNY